MSRFTVQELSGRVCKRASESRFSPGSPVAMMFGDLPASGSSSLAARGDHIHAFPPAPNTLEAFQDTFSIEGGLIPFSTGLEDSGIGWWGSSVTNDGKAGPDGEAFGAVTMLAQKISFTTAGLLVGSVQNGAPSADTRLENYSLASARRISARVARGPGSLSKTGEFIGAFRTDPDAPPFFAPVNNNGALKNIIDGVYFQRGLISGVVSFFVATVVSGGFAVSSITSKFWFAQKSKRFEIFLSAPDIDGLQTVTFCIDDDISAILKNPFPLGKVPGFGAGIISAKELEDSGTILIDSIRVSGVRS